MAISKLLQARRVSSSTFSTLAMCSRLTIELRIWHCLGVKAVIRANNGGPQAT